MAIPGIVLGLSYVIFFNGTSIYGTILIVALVNSIHFFASPYLMMYNTLEKVNPNLEAVGSSLGVSRVHIVIDVIIPKVKYTLFEMFVYFFVNSMMTISAVSFLAPPAPKPVALMINQFEAQLLMESAAFVSLLILLINVLLKIIMAAIKKKTMVNEV
jgi:iron(III) transport system permease protein